MTHISVDIAHLRLNIFLISKTGEKALQIRYKMHAGRRAKEQKKITKTTFTNVTILGVKVGFLPHLWEQLSLGTSKTSNRS